MENGTRLAAIDLGSNSYRLEIGTVDHGQIRRAEYLKETVRQGNGLDSARNLTPDAMQRGWDTLARFAERLSGFAPSQVRAVATQTLREARNRDEFLLRARTILGFGIDVISGREEARLIYQGVAHLLPHDDRSNRERRLVIDIGGRSTEMIIGRGLQAEEMESYRVGSVAWSMRYFPEGQFTPAAFRAAQIAAKAVLDDALDTYLPDRWDVVYGASGTIGAVGDLLAAARGTPARITREGLDWLLERLQKAGSADRLRLDGLRDDRKAVIGGGLSVLRAVFDLLEIEEMQVAQGALRHGVLYELMEREDGAADLRDRTVARLAVRFGVDARQAARVADTAEALFKQLVPQNGLGEAAVQRTRQALRQLRWSAQLHEIGTLIAHSDYHKHGAYVLSNADAPGFSANELQALAQLVLGQRGKLRKVAPALEDEGFAAQLLALRLAIVLCHARRDPDVVGISLQSGSGCWAQLAVKSEWADGFPQSFHLLQEECDSWRKSSNAVTLTVVDIITPRI